MTSFEQPLALLLLPLALLAIRGPGERSRPRVAFPAAAVARGVRPSLRRRLGLLARAPRGVAVAFVVVALAGPRVGSTVERVSASGIDVLLVLDTSVSMTTDLGERSRLEVAKEVIDDFVARRPQDRIGLLTFAKYPRLACPLTLDHAAVRAFLAEVEPVEAREERSTTAIGVALAAAVLRLAEDGGRTRIVVLLTDGEEQEHAVEPIEAAELARARGVRVHVVSVAKRSGRFTEELTRVGRATGGDGYAATGAGELADAYARIDALERHEIAEERHVRWKPLHAALLALALAMVLLDAPLRQLVLRRSP